MRFLLLLLFVLPCSSCVVAPYVKESPDGSVTASMGGVFAARRKNTVAEITTRQGHHIKYMSEEESGEDVPKAGISALAAKWLAAIQGDVTKHEASTDSATTLGLGAQRVESERIAAGVSGATVVNPNIPLPLRK